LDRSGIIVLVRLDEVRKASVSAFAVFAAETADYELPSDAGAVYGVPETIIAKE